jgi:hypothetical protein
MGTPFLQLKLNSVEHVWVEYPVGESYSYDLWVSEIGVYSVDYLFFYFYTVNVYQQNNNSEVVLKPSSPPSDARIIYLFIL